MSLKCSSLYSILFYFSLYSNLYIYAFNLLAFVNAIKILANLQKRLRNCCEHKGRHKKEIAILVNLIARELKSIKLFLEKMDRRM